MPPQSEQKGVLYELVEFKAIGVPQIVPVGVE
jgi:hypothetical protein